MIALTTVFVITCTVTVGAHAAKPEVSITISEGWSGVFGGQRVDFHLRVTVGRPFQGRVAWSLAVDGATAARNEAPVRASAGSPVKVLVPLQVPNVKPGVIVPAVLTVSITADGSGRPLASLRKQLWIFPKDPFYERTHWLKQLNIRLFDPKGDTLHVLQTARVPSARADNLDALADLDGGVLIIGQGISLVDYPGLADVMISAASQGTAVLCLAPAEGQLVLPGTEESDRLQPGRFTLRRSDVIHALDKRLDAAAWPEDGRVLATSLAIRSDRSQVVGVVVPSESDWAWLEVRFGPGYGKLIVCGFDLVGKWKAGPTPRFLFARLLEYLVQENTSSLTKGVVP